MNDQKIKHSFIERINNDLKEVRHANKMFSWIEELVTNKGDLTCSEK